MTSLERFKHRLAIALGRTVRELEESLGADEWDDWLRFHYHYDLPDGFLVTGRIGSLVCQMWSGKGAISDFAAYYAKDPETVAPGRPRAGRGTPPPIFGFLAANVPHLRRNGDGKQVP